MLFPIQTVIDQDLIMTTTESVNENKRHCLDESKCINEYPF